MNYPLKITVTGANGFIGFHVLRYLKDHFADCSTITAAGRSESKLSILRDRFNIQTIPLDIASPPQNCFEYLGTPDIVIHLAWGHLDQFKNPAHLSEELPNHLRFLKAMIEGGLKSLTVSGTCLEYGLIEGLLNEETPVNPVTVYGMAKAALYASLTDLVQNTTCNLKWLRYFYIFGEGQSPRSIIPQLEHAIRNREATFNMSNGEQIRDYLSVEKVAEYTVAAALQNRVSGAIQICSGNPISILDLVKKRIHERNVSIALNTGFYPPPDYEPKAFWGDRTKLNQLLANYSADVTT